MPRAYSNDLRRKFLQAYDEGEDSLEELAELEQAQQMRLSMGRMWLALRQLGLPLKKRAPRAGAR